ncbi:tetratricopeptide repeat protein [Candidatus Saganbacteria bacterium]|uniref:Tetratricopeptide repeat protein n=1 Tax=Candidatus Saganbacteria bacterium TaxID=2575572 RepID=A0A9D6UKR6_UNCSA|nr:tetratricopeptide repeat protein [Candidatus Saganbacteria bacterium]
MSTILLLSTLASLPLLAQTEEGNTLLTRALQARREGEIKASISLFRQAVEDKDSPLLDYVQFEIGETYYSSGEYSAAIPEYNAVITRHPKSILLPKADLMIGKSYFNLKKNPAAIKTFRHLIGEYPDANEAAEARFLSAAALQNAGKWKEAYLAYEETDLYHPLTYFGKKSRLAIKALKKAHRKKLPRFTASAKALFKKGMTYFEQDDFEMAANIFNRLAREYPGSRYVGKAWLMLGRAEMQTSKFSSAIPDLEHASRFDGRAYYYLGLAHGRRGNFDRAIASLQKVVARYPNSSLADETSYWIAYYQEAKGDTAGALASYYDFIASYPYSKAISAAIWRLGRAYYWGGDFKNAAAYLHLAQLYPPGENTPRCYFFEAKALERIGSHAQAIETYKKLAGRFDHAYYGYRAQEKLAGGGIPSFPEGPLNSEDFSEALSSLNNNQPENLSAIMEIWEQVNSDTLQNENSREARIHLEKYKGLIALGLGNYAADEARYLVNITSDKEKESAQTKLGEMLTLSGNYHLPLRFADRKVKAAVLAGKPQSLPKKLWQMAYPRAYWKYAESKADRFGIDPYLVLAVIREESRFNPKATSRSRARGLMQIMPRTGRGIAQNLKLSHYRTKRLYEPFLNVEMGTYYLSNLIRNFSNNAYLALAGYNGGPNRIKKYVNSWYNGNTNLVDIDEFVESIPSRETRLYVQKVMESYFEYKRLYERKRG